MLIHAIKFMVYTFGVIGLLLIAYIVAKRCMGLDINTRKKGNLFIEETLNITPRKTLYVLRAYDERFLIASDANSTSFLAKLNSDESITDKLTAETDFSRLINDSNDFEQNENDKVKDKISEVQKKNVLHSMLEKIK